MSHESEKVDLKLGNITVTTRAQPSVWPSGDEWLLRGYTAAHTAAHIADESTRVPITTTHEDDPLVQDVDDTLHEVLVAIREAVHVVGMGNDAERLIALGHLVTTLVNAGTELGG